MPKHKKVLLRSTTCAYASKCCYGQNGVDKEVTWKKCVSAIHKRLHQLKANNGPNENARSSLGGSSFESHRSSSGRSTCGSISGSVRLNDGGDDFSILYC